MFIHFFTFKIHDECQIQPFPWAELCGDILIVIKSYYEQKNTQVKH